MTQRRAVVLRGPPCGGKTVVTAELVRLLPSPPACVSLDNGWGRDEWRFRGVGRYSDLGSKVEDTLIIELGFGEPIGESFPGATRDPTAWLRVLAQADRSVHLFLLQPPLEETFRRILKDRPPHLQQYYRCAALRYETGGVCSHEAFTERLGGSYLEHKVDTSGETEKTTAERILRAIGGA